MLAKNRSDTTSNIYFIKVGYALPLWKTYGYENKSDWDSIQILENTPWKRTGFDFRFGKIYYLNSMKNNHSYMIGANVEFLNCQYTHFNKKQNDLFVYDRQLSFSSNVGPVITYKPTGKLNIDIYGNAKLTWTTLNYIDLYTYEPFIGPGGDSLPQPIIPVVSDITYNNIVGIRFSAGGNIRYSNIMLGMDFNFGSLKLNNYKGAFRDRHNAKTNDPKVPLQSLNISIGYYF